MKSFTLGLIKFYQAAVSPYYGPACRYEPTCSAYGYGAIEKHGAAMGAWLTAKRLARCHPLSKGGYDPIP